ncbi:hypothetical protein H0W91_03195 [Patescibacteria group bacterium]|nr:hypothetical protein [Patescibacteria group bacterium]
MQNPIELTRRRLPDERKGFIHRFQIEGGHKGYITVGIYEDGTPGELFIVMSKGGSTLSGLMDTIAVSVSMLLQHGVPLKLLVKKFANTRFEPFGQTSNLCIPEATSISDYIFRWLGMKFLSLEELTEIGVLTKCHQCEKVIVGENTSYTCIACLSH